MRTHVYVDGFNLYYAIRNSGCKWLNIKALAQAVLPNTHTVEKVKYYTARVSGAANPNSPRDQHLYLSALGTVPEIEIFYGSFLAKQQWRPILNLPIANRDMAAGAQTHQFPAATYPLGLDATLPKCAAENLVVGSYPNGGRRQAPANPLPDAVKAQVFVMEEKGSDVNLAVHLVNDAWGKKFDAAAVISNDTDLIEPIRIVAEELNLPVILLCPSQRGVAAPLGKVATSVRHINRSHLNASRFADPLTKADGSQLLKPADW